jgi:mannose-6-phosphate isomerase-like protein (cupin superfamily)
VSVAAPAGGAAPRRVVTGRSPAGAAVFVSDGPAETLAGHLVPPGIEEIWGADVASEAPNDGSPQRLSRYFPPAGGYRVRVITFRPDASAPLTPEQTEEIGRLLVGVHEDADWDPERPGMHSTASVDIGHVLEGSVVLELDSGESTTLQAGDWFVQNGTRHTWRNPADVPCRVLIVMIGAEPASGGA